MATGLTRKELVRKARAFRDEVQIQLSSLKGTLVSIVESVKLLDEEYLVKSSADVIRDNFESEQKFRNILRNLNTELSDVKQSITSADPPENAG